MNLAEYTIRHKVVSWMFALLLLIGGSFAFLGLGQLEFPEFTIKNALVITNYPGASAEQVEEEVTLKLEDAIQQLDAIKHITSINSSGLSQIEITVKDSYDKTDLPQVWDEVRRKVNDESVQLPSGTLPPLVIDDFGDVYGILYNIVGEGFSNRELQNYADYLRRELVLVPGVKKVSIEGVIPEQVVVEISQQKLASLGLDQSYIYGLITSQNVVSNAGSVLVGKNRIRIHPSGEFQSVEEMERLVISSPGSDELIYLGDIARVYKTLSETPKVLYHSNGQSAVSMGISFGKGVNVVEVGELIHSRMNELESKRPLGIELETVYNQSEMVDSTIKGFLINLAESVGIVIIVLLVFMGVRSGLLMGAVLLLTILGTFMVMNVMGIQLQIISLGALIIALGMLVDNAIVVTEGILIAIQKKQSRLQAAKNVVQQTQWPLLGATVIAIIAFAPIGLSETGAGEFCNSLFKVLLISLSISWITAMTLTPFFCHLLFKSQTESNNDVQVDPYKGWFFTVYRGLLKLAIRFRAITLILVLSSFALAVSNFGNIKSVFFPPSNTPIFFVDVWLPEGTDVLATDEFVTNLEDKLLDVNESEKLGILSLSSVIGQGMQRFVLPYVPEKGYASYAQLLIEMDSLSTIVEKSPVIQQQLRAHFPEAKFRFKRLENGPTPAAKLEARFYGDDPDTLRMLAHQAEAIFNSEPTADNVRHTWRNSVHLLRPQISDARAREAGISKQDIDSALLVNFSGNTVGTYRETSHLLPIVARAPENERLDADSIRKLQVWSSQSSSFVPLEQLVSSFETQSENPLIIRRDRKRMIAVVSDPELSSNETADSVLKKLREEVESIPLPDGYELEWGGEYETSTEARVSVFGSLPAGYLVMFLITVILFNSVRQPLVIWFTVPLALIGMVAGLLLFDAPFSFMALLGLLSLSGMVIKNGIVLVDQINVELSSGKDAYWAVVDSSVSRVRPVFMAAITTMLGMLPLINDAFFSSMAITIIFGLGVSSILTLIVLPVAYTIIFGIKVPSFNEPCTPGIEEKTEYQL
ncbi:efflux RND transporter permease subunit [Vibrio sp. Isolate22]|uniref:efflux RND transporter permease subunit n=1 Tax=Vibrio sp. Isolate22 TaxID=2908532 RepID=UPI001EFDFD75|nr:efflux RND transporter permease subunit [Vibrio sp. Isolate22]MCG9695232.1 efflux RND transporter permease subunit [Vibrio sp. Isolate22]